MVVAVLGDGAVVQVVGVALAADVVVPSFPSIRCLMATEPKVFLTPW